MGRANHQSTPVCARVGTYAVQSLSETEVAGGARGLAAVSGSVNHRTISYCILHIINPKMSSDWSDWSSDVDTDIESASEAHGVHVFSLDELKKHRGERLGGGMFGIVYTIEGFPGLAVKEIYLNGQPDRLVEITKFELEALSRFSHPGVLKYHQVLTKDDFFYVVMDRYSSDLDKFIAKYRKTHEPIPRELLLSIARQLANALAYVHNLAKVDASGYALPSIVHRDLKPANIMMSRDGERVIIADFGICKDAQHDGSTLAGTKAYMAPETLLSNKTSRASDIWALGVIIYELATLKRPNFLSDKEPECVFINGWKLDLSSIKSDSIRIILGKIFVLSSEKRPTARSFQELFNPSISSMGMLRLRIASLEDALGAAGAKTGALGEAIAALKGRIDAQSAEIASLRAGNRVAALSEAERQSVQTSKSSLDLNKHRPSNPQAASRNAISLLRSLASKYGP